MASLHSVSTRRQAMATGPSSRRHATPSAPGGGRRHHHHHPHDRAATKTTLRAAATAAEEGIIDPMTGEVIEARSAKNPVAGLSADVDGRRWAYRRSELSPGATPEPVQVLCVHGLGSSSYAFRNVLALLGAEGYDAVAPDLPGHGDSAPASGEQSPEAFARALDAFVAAAGLKRPLALVVQGYVTAQYALLWALENEQDVDKLVILNTPLAKNSKLRPELAAFKPALPFLPKPSSFDAAAFASTGSPYYLSREDGDAYGRSDPYAAVAAAMDALDFAALLKRVDDGFMSWRRPSVVLHGGEDPFLPLGGVFDFLDSKRTCMQAATIGLKIGHCPQEDAPEAVVGEVVVPFLRGTWTPLKAAAPNAKRR